MSPLIARLSLGFWVLLAATPAWAHEGELLAPHDLWTAWTWDPGVVIPLALSAFLYWRGSHPARGVRRWEIACFWGGWVSLFIALCSPIHPLGEALFSAHMVQHEILMLVAAPLLVLGRPLVPFLWALPPSWRRAAGGLGKSPAVSLPWHLLTNAAVATFIQAVALWVWHAPALYQATLENETVHAAQHLSFLGAALLFWWSILRGREGRQPNYGAGVIYLFLTLMHTGALGALLTFSPELWYPAYQSGVGAWGMTPLEDQIAAGLIMWVPAGLVYIAAAVALCASCLKTSDLRADSWYSAVVAGPPEAGEPSTV
jgi:putative membrane protein